MIRITLILLLSSLGWIPAQESDTLISLDSLAVTDTLKITDSLWIQPADSMADSLTAADAESDSLVTVDDDKDSIQLPPERGQSIQDLHFLIGKWKGEGWRLMPDGEKTYLVQTEVVESKQNGDVLIIEGVGIDKESLRTKPRVVHNAFAIVYFNMEIRKVQIMAFNRGRRIVTEPDIINDRSFQWGFILPEVGQFRYLIELTDFGEWHEIGEFSPDGQQWIQNLEITLTRVN
jgi:hypothetical protein